MQGMISETLISSQNAAILTLFDRSMAALQCRNIATEDSATATYDWASYLPRSLNGLQSLAHKPPI